mgnify:CR=1 FL=1
MIALCIVFIFIYFYTIGKMKLDCDKKIKEKNDADANICEQLYIGCANTVDQCLTKFPEDLMTIDN